MLLSHNGEYGFESEAKAVYRLELKIVMNSSKRQNNRRSVSGASIVGEQSRNGCLTEPQGAN